jgi:5'-nucleotidase (lipoprotein e(P4) family)
MLKLILVFIFVVSCAKQPVNNKEYQVGAYLWQQTSGEYRALCYQAYNLARLKLDRDLENKHNKRRAVIFDIDETVLDNSVLGAQDIQNNTTWNPDGFNQWVKLRIADAIPGAREFIEYANENRVEVFYVSNRNINQIEDTLKNFELLKIPAKKENFYFMNSDSNKESRRKEIQKKYEVVLYFGDTLADFDQTWEKKNSLERRKIVDEKSQEFGSRFIVLPNPLYGDWENALLEKQNRNKNLITKPLR